MQYLIYTDDDRTFYKDNEVDYIYDHNTFALHDLDEVQDCIDELMKNPNIFCDTISELRSLIEDYDEDTFKTIYLLDALYFEDIERSNGCVAMPTANTMIHRTHLKNIYTAIVEDYNSIKDENIATIDDLIDEFNFDEYFLNLSYSNNIGYFYMTDFDARQALYNIHFKEVQQ